MGDIQMYDDLAYVQYETQSLLCYTEACVILCVRKQEVKSH